MITKIHNFRILQEGEDYWCDNREKSAIPHEKVATRECRRCHITLCGPCFIVERQYDCQA